MRSIFFGGGTPSLAPPDVIASVIERIDRTAGLAADCEISLEANPGTVDSAHFAGYRAAGVNRLSLGVQSFDSQLLHKIGRIHDGEQARQAIALARRLGFDNINLDLMVGLPGQTEQTALADIETALSFQPEHLSHYQLTLEPNTPFFARPPKDLLMKIPQIVCKPYHSSVCWRLVLTVMKCRHGAQVKTNRVCITSIIGSLATTSVLVRVHTARLVLLMDVFSDGSRPKVRSDMFKR